MSETKKYLVGLIHSEGRPEEVEMFGVQFTVNNGHHEVDLDYDQWLEARATNRFDIQPAPEPEAELEPESETKSEPEQETESESESAQESEETKTKKVKK